MQSVRRQPVRAPMEKEQQHQIEQLITETKKKTLSVEKKIKYLEESQETLLFRYKTYVEVSGQSTDPYMERKKLEIKDQLKKWIKNRKEVLDQIKELLEHCENLHSILVEEITILQRLSCIGANTNISLKQTEAWVTEIGRIFLQLKRLLGRLCELLEKESYDEDPLTDPQQLMQRLLEMLHSLIQRSFVVDKQPVMTEHLNRPLVVKTRTQFCVSARLLVNLPNLSPTMNVSYVLDKDPPNIKGRYRRFKLSGPDAKTMEDTPQEGLVVEYKHLQLKAEKAGKRGNGGKGPNDVSSSVIEELHIITLMTQVNFEGVNLKLEAATLPFVVISHLSQLEGAFASVLWFNLLSSDPKDVNFFSSPPVAPWSQLSEALSWQFSCCTERGLDSDQQEMLREKLCGNVAQEDSIVTWSKFAKENIPPNYTFTFWAWFTAVVGLVKTHLENIWNAGYVMGFVSRHKEDALLKTMQQGTFLLRFSESACDGGITCSYVDHNPDGTYMIHSVQPFTKEELKKIPSGFTEIIRNYQVLFKENLRENPLKYLYPNIPKDEAFRPYYEQTSKDNAGYKKRQLIVVSESNIDDTESSSASGTPLHYPETPHNISNISVHGQKVPKEVLLKDRLLSGRIQPPTIPVRRRTSSKADDSQTSTAPGTPLHCTETPHDDHNISVCELELTTEDSINQLLNEIHMEDFLMNLNIDPMISSSSVEYDDELSSDICFGQWDTAECPFTNAPAP